MQDTYFDPRNSEKNLELARLQRNGNLQKQAVLANIIGIVG